MKVTSGLLLRSSVFSMITASGCHAHHPPTAVVRIDVNRIGASCLVELGALQRASGQDLLALVRAGKRCCLMEEGDFLGFQIVSTTAGDFASPLCALGLGRSVDPVITEEERRQLEHLQDHDGFVPLDGSTPH